MPSLTDLGGLLGCGLSGVDLGDTTHPLTLPRSAASSFANEEGQRGDESDDEGNDGEAEAVLVGEFLSSRILPSLHLPSEHRELDEDEESCGRGGVGGVNRGRHVVSGWIG